jgi:ATP-binding cassette subfamily B protein
LRRFRRVVGLFLRYRGALLAGGICLLASNALVLAIPLLEKRAVDLVAPISADPEAVPLPAQERIGLLGATALAIVGLAALRGLFLFLQRRLLVGVSRRVEADLKRDLFAHLTTLSLPTFDRLRTGDLISRMTGDVEAVRMLLGPGVMYLASAVLLVPGAFAFMAQLDPVLTILVAVPLGALALAMKRLAPALHENSRAVQETLSEISHRAQENFAAVRVVKGFAREAWEISRFRAASDLYRRHQVEFGELRARTHALFGAAQDAAALLIFVLGGLGVLQGTFTFGGIVLFLAYVRRLFWPLLAVGWIVGAYERAAAGMDRIEEIFRTQPLVRDDPDAQPVAIGGSVEIRDLTFAYDGTPALRGVNLRIPRGSVVGLVGPIGSGKSTLLSLLGRLYPVPPGRVFVDGVDVNRIRLADLRGAIAIVPQDPFLFSDTVRENVAFGFEEPPSEDSMARAVAAAALEEDVAAFPDGLDTRIGERGITLSGGQRQRVAIARALMRDAPLLLLDDALSSVDAETEARILENLRAAARGRTVFLVAHRLSTVARADRIAVISEGRLVEEGTHETLLARGGWYARTWRRQRLEAEAGL